MPNSPQTSASDAGTDDIQLGRHGRADSLDRAPRGRTTSGEKITLDTWKTSSAADLLNSLIVERMLAGRGVAPSHRGGRTAERPRRTARSISKSAKLAPTQ